MKKYEFVEMDTGGFWKSNKYEHRDIIENYAQKGYSYVGYVPIKVNAEGRINSIDLIFEVV